MADQSACRPVDNCRECAYLHPNTLLLPVPDRVQLWGASWCYGAKTMTKRGDAKTAFEAPALSRKRQFGLLGEEVE